MLFYLGIILLAAVIICEDEVPDLNHI